MNWLTNFVRPKIQALVQKSDVPENLWQQCPACEQMVFHRELEAALQVCPHCGHHLRLAAAERLKIMFDDGEFETLALPSLIGDPLKFKDLKRYADRLKDARAAAEEGDALIVAHGAMGGAEAVIAAFDFKFMGGSMGLAVGNGLLQGAKLAVERNAPFIVFPASGGARMQEGILSLMQMPRTVLAIDQVKQAGLPYIVVLTDPTTGGVTASFAMLGDIAIAEPGALIGFAGARVIEETIRERLPEGFQRAEYLYEHGMVDMVVHRHQIRDEIIHLTDLLMNRGPGAEIVPIDRPGPAAARGRRPDDISDTEERDAAE